MSVQTTRYPNVLGVGVTKLTKTCKHPDIRFLHLALKECREAECVSGDTETCDLVICVDCGEDVNG